MSFDCSNFRPPHKPVSMRERRMGRIRAANKTLQTLVRNEFVCTFRTGGWVFDDALWLAIGPAPPTRIGCAITIKGLAAKPNVKVDRTSAVSLGFLRQSNLRLCRESATLSRAVNVCGTLRGCRSGSRELLSLETPSAACRPSCRCKRMCMKSPLPDPVLPLSHQTPVSLRRQSQENPTIGIALKKLACNICEIACVARSAFDYLVHPLSCKP
jgi:hypothetical protein